MTHSDKQPLYRFQSLDLEGPLTGIVIGPKAVPDPTAASWRMAQQSRTTFWRRQFGDVATPMQRKFDWAFGVVLPLICFYCDPFVFTNANGAGLLSNFAPFAYALAFTSIMAMAAWLLWGEKLRAWSAALSGLFLAGSLISLAVGVCLLPFSIIGTAFLIGILGYTPLFTAVIYARNGVRTLRAGRAHIDWVTAAHISGLAAVASISLPWLLNQIIK